MSFSIKKFLGLTIEPPLTDIETCLLTQLQANRKVALKEIIPDTLMIQFITTIYSDRNLKSITKKICRSKFIGDKADLRISYYAEDLLRSCLSMNHFGRNLILHHGINPQAVVDIMLRDINS
jgi:uncharacterized membrane protein